ncbi:MAG TPA: MFS transporter [Myxococcales bacterium]
MRRAVDVRPDEVRAMLLACLYFFFLLSSYFILRPIRDAMAVAAGVSKLPWLFAGTLIAMLVCNPLFSWLVVRFSVKRFIVIAYQFFAINLVAFYLLARILPGQGEPWLGRAFFVWTSVFNLFVVSIFWCFMADTFRSGQGKRLFGFIGVGGTLGALIGSATTALLVPRIGASQLLLISAGLLELAVLIVLLFPRQGARGDAQSALRASLPIGGGIWSGITHLWRSPYLLGIAAFIVLFVLGTTVLYFEQTDVVGKYFSTRETRTQILARIDFAAQFLTAMTQLFLTGRIIRRIGLPITLALMPAISVLGFAVIGATAFAASGVLATFVVFSTLRRATNIGLTNPAMEVLFTVVSREDKYKAKSFIETFIYRSGDQLGAWAYGALAAAGLGLAGIAWLAVPMCIIFVWLGIWLGRQEELRATAIQALQRDAGVSPLPR